MAQSCLNFLCLSLLPFFIFSLPPFCPSFPPSFPTFLIIVVLTQMLINTQVVTLILGWGGSQYPAVNILECEKWFDRILGLFRVRCDVVIFQDESSAHVAWIWHKKGDTLPASESLAEGKALQMLKNVGERNLLEVKRWSVVICFFNRS